MQVILSHAPNPDIRGGYWEPTQDSRRPKAVEVKTLAEASKVCRDYISRNGLGGGNWTGGKIVCPERGIVGYVSYNGRVWDREPWGTTEAKEIFDTVQVGA